MPHRLEIPMFCKAVGKFGLKSMHFQAQAGSEGFRTFPYILKRMGVLTVVIVTIVT
jgi:hypothetical protein